MPCCKLRICASCSISAKRNRSSKVDTCTWSIFFEPTQKYAWTRVTAGTVVYPNRTPASPNSVSIGYNSYLVLYTNSSMYDCLCILPSAFNIVVNSYCNLAHVCHIQYMLYSSSDSHVVTTNYCESQRITHVCQSQLSTSRPSLPPESPICLISTQARSSQNTVFNVCGLALPPTSSYRAGIL